MRNWIVATLIAAAATAAGAAHTGTKGQQATAERRVAQIETIIEIGESAIANPRWLESEAWHGFVDQLRGQARQGLSDPAFRSWFNEAAGALPFTHFRLFWRKPPGNGSDDEPGIEVREPAGGLALLSVKRFDVPVENVHAATAQVLRGDYRGLIIDLRGNEGGSFPSVVALTRSLSNEPLDAGVFLTRKWFVEHGGYPDAGQRAAIPMLETLNLEAFSRQLQDTGAVRLVLPDHDDPVFRGPVIILTDQETASAAEPFVYLMQQRGAVVIGQHTAGAMLSAERIPVDDTFVLFVPVADYLAPDGKRLDRVGVMPDIEVPAERALSTGLEYLKQDASR